MLFTLQDEFGALSVEQVCDLAQKRVVRVRVTQKVYVLADLGCDLCVYRNEALECEGLLLINVEFLVKGEGLQPFFAVESECLGQELSDLLPDSDS